MRCYMTLADLSVALIDYAAGMKGGSSECVRWDQASGLLSLCFFLSHRSVPRPSSFFQAERHSIPWRYRRALAGKVSLHFPAPPSAFLHRPGRDSFSRERNVGFYRGSPLGFGRMSLPIYPPDARHNPGIPIWLACIHIDIWDRKAWLRC
jgi:hypothetical protein